MVDRVDDASVVLADVVVAALVVVESVENDVKSFLNAVNVTSWRRNGALLGVCGQVWPMPEIPYSTVRLRHVPNVHTSVSPPVPVSVSESSPFGIEQPFNSPYVCR